MRILADVTAILGPGLIGIGAVGVPAITGLAAQMGFAATAAGTAVLAFQGVGDTLKALNKAALNPTTENLERAQTQLDKLSPAAQQFVSHLGTMIPELQKLRDVAAEGLFPGLTRGLDSLEGALPRVQGLLAAVSTELGDIAGDAGQSLASERWTPFLDFIAQEAPAALRQMADAAGNTAHAVAELFMATAPVNANFGNWLVDVTADLDKWATGLSKTKGFADFVAYLDQTGPKVAAAFGAIASAALQIVQAAAPLSGPVLDGVKALADVVSSIANSDLGTPLFTAVAALALFNRTIAVTASLQRGTFGGPAVTSIKNTGASIRGLTTDLALLNRQSSITRMPGKGFVGPLTEAQSALGRIRTSAASMGKTAALIGGIGLASSGAADKIGLTNTASLALMGTFISPGWGTAIGGAAGLLLDAAHSSGRFADEMKRANDAIRESDVSKLTASLDELKKKRDAVEGSVGTPLPRGQSRAFLDAKVLGDKADEVQKKLDMTKAAASQKLLAAGFKGTAAGIDKATESAEDFQTELQKLNDALAGRANIRDYEAALDDFTKSLHKNGQTLDINTEKGRNNQAALDAIASNALKVAQTLTGAQRATFLDAARADFVKAAKAAGLTKDAAQALADKVLGLKNVTGRPKIVIDANGAWRVIDETAARLERLTRKTYKINIAAQAAKNKDIILDIHDGTADGGTIGGARYPYADKVLVPLAPGEEVITNRNGEADRWRPLLKRINAGLANGGTVPFSTPAPVGMGIDYDRLAAALANARPLYGDVKLQPHNYSEFRREMEADQRKASRGGSPR
jgi:hypothetical protein